MRLSDFLGATVVTELGWPVGHVIDVRTDERDDALEVTELLVGRQAFAERVLGGRRGHGPGRTAPHEGIAWESVVAVEPGRRVVVREGTEPGSGREEVEE
jgi:sporulation protein YlmC with PRC-barrel domain